MKPAIQYGVTGILMGTLAIGVRGRPYTPHGGEPLSERTIRLVEVTRVNVASRAQVLRVWLPMLADDNFQKVQLVKLKALGPYRLTWDPQFGNRLTFLELKNLSPQAVEIRVHYRIQRREQRGAYAPDSSPTSLDRQPQGLVAITDEIREIARAQTLGLSSAFEKARALYAYVYSHMRYDKTGHGWGRGDSVYACRVGKGNCTDFHSLFIALARASGIPARFRMGLALPAQTKGRLEGYHCWADFYIPKKGWIPVDISEAWKHPDKADYYFGNVDANRILMSSGREIILSPAQAGPPLNYLAGAYAELDGRPVENITVERSFKEEDRT